MARQGIEKQLRWDDVNTESQRQRLLAQTIRAIREVLDTPARKELIKDVVICGRSYLTDGYAPVLNKDGLAIRHSVYTDGFNVFWTIICGIIGIKVKDPAIEVGWASDYTYLHTDEEIIKMVEEYKISAGDVYKAKSLLEI